MTKGDINGLISKLDYLKELGINCLWLPMYPSPGKDDGMISKIIIKYTQILVQ